MFKIGDFSKLTQVSVRMLRYYDETDLLKPTKIDRDTGYRMYSVDQIPILRRIITLRDMGFIVSEISNIINSNDENSISKALEVKRKEIQLNICAEREKLIKLETAIRNIGTEDIHIDYEVFIKSIPSYQVLSLREIIPEYKCEGVLWEKIFRFIEEEKINYNKNSICFAIYHDLDYKEKDVDVEVVVTVDSMGEDKGEYRFLNTEPVENMACIMVYGSFDNIGPAYKSFAKWLEKHKVYKIWGKNRQICHIGPWNEENQEKYLTEIQIPITKNNRFIE